MDSLKNIIGKNTIKEPEEFTIIKAFVNSEIGIVPTLKINKKQIAIYVPSAAAAGHLQYKIHLLQKKLTSRLIIRIG